jgi:PAS domain S-box-containing protein
VQTCLEKLQVLDVNRATVEMYGATSKEDLLSNLAQTFTKEFLKAFKAGLVALADGLTEVDIETQTRKLSGELIYNTVKWNLVKGRDDAHILLVTVIDISERRQVELALQKSEQRYRTLFENASDIIQVLSPEGRLLYVNPTWLRTFGYSRDEVATMKVFDLIHPDCADLCYNNFNLVLTEGRVENVEVIFKAKDDRKVIVEGNVNCHMEDGSPQYVQCIFHDVTDRKKMEDELRKAHKLESIGILAGGIAHDFNNILTAIIGNISLARIYSKPGDKIYEKLGDAERATLRAKDLTHQLLTFSKGGEPIKRSIDIQQLVREASSFVLRGSNVKCSCNLAVDLWAVEADEGQLSQVIHNLVINADQAMPEGGQITITAQNRVIAANDNLPLQEGSYVVVTIEDYGIGIKEEHLNRVFDPYFSTKQKGHGLGLATAYSIMKNHGGLLTVNSTIGHGSTLTMYIPAAQKNAVQETAEHEGLHQGNGRILLMDDEEDVRKVASEMLTYIGYEVTTAPDGREALELYEKARQAGKPYDAVIMDLTIPGGLGGKETMSELLAIDPAVKAIVSSGYANDPIMANYSEYGFAGVVPKPYKFEQLSNVLKKLVN